MRQLNGFVDATFNLCVLCTVFMLVKQEKMHSLVQEEDCFLWFFLRRKIRVVEKPFISTLTAFLLPISHGHLLSREAHIANSFAATSMPFPNFCSFIWKLWKFLCKRQKRNILQRRMLCICEKITFSVVYMERKKKVVWINLEIYIIMTFQMLFFSFFASFAGNGQPFEDTRYRYSSHHAVAAVS